jgi:hypothetical protein
LSFKELEGRHTGERLSKEVLDILIEFDLCTKLFCITSDNAGNMGKLMKCLSKRLATRGVIWNAKENHISCLNHVLNLAIQAFLKKIKALPSIEEEALDLKDKEDKDENCEEDMEIDDNEEDEEKEDGVEDIFHNQAVVEGDADYDTIDTDFQGTMKKLRGIAKVHDVANKVTFSALSEHFYTLQVLCPS